eukprot:scaffold150664_cov37-Tisochrysis_lutea.AAC.3
MRNRCPSGTGAQLVDRLTDRRLVAGWGRTIADESRRLVPSPPGTNSPLGARQSALPLPHPHITYYIFYIWHLA